MVDSVNAVGSGDYFSTSGLPEKYDFNKDGKVDISDYNLAAEALAEEDTETYEGLTKTELDTVFDSLIKSSAAGKVTEDNAMATAQEIIDNINSGIIDPKNATTLNNLQDIGKTLSSYIEKCATLKQILATKLEKAKQELDDLEEEKNVREAEYADKEAEVDAKSAELSSKMIYALNEASRLSQDQETRADVIIKQCVKDYKDGKYPATTLTELIATQLGKTGDGYRVSALRALLDGNSDMAKEIKSICSDIDTLVGDIKGINERYNSKNTEYNNILTTRNGIIEASTKASQLYQTGYQQRIDMRKAIHDKYYVEGNGGVTAKNEQIQKLNDFLTNKELDKMPFADAWEILSTTFDNCRIKFGDDGSLKVPKGHDATAKNVFNELVDALERNYGINVTQYDEEEFQTGGDGGGVTEITGVKRTDPISFNVGDVKYEFISDNNNNGKFDDASEFLGANRGWSEMKTFDTDGDGKVSGDELKELKLVQVNQKNGQYTFMTAEDAGIESIDLSSYKHINKTELNNNVTVGSFNISMDSGQVIKGVQTEDTMKNMQNTYSNLFESDIADLSETYEENPFMEDFVERVNTQLVADNAEQDVKKNALETDEVMEATDRKVENKAIRETNKAIGEKTLSDAIEAREEARVEAKKKAKEEQKAQEAKEEKKAEEEKEKADKKANKK